MTGLMSAMREIANLIVQVEKLGLGVVYCSAICFIYCELPEFSLLQC